MNKTTKCEKCEFYNNEKKQRTEDCPNKDSPETECDFTTCSDFIIKSKLVYF